MSKKNEVKNLLKHNEDLKSMLFSRGYLISTSNWNIDEYPFYDNWTKNKFSFNGKSIYIYVHKKQDFTYYEEEDTIIAMIGHAYNPFTMKYKEKEILEELSLSLNSSESKFFDQINELTGIFLILVIKENQLILVQDCSGLKSCYFGIVEGEINVSSHPQLIGDIYNLEVDEFVAKLIKTKAYNIGNKHLPGNITPFKELKRLGGNTFIRFEAEFKIERFYPNKPISPITDDESFKTQIDELVQLIHNNIELATKKWSRPAISLTGGMDSRTTLACANGLYDNFKYFSFYSKPQEEVDAKAAKNICDNLDLPHILYPIPEQIDNFSNYKKIIDHNSSYFKNTADHEIRKIIYLNQKEDFDIELKSWASETTRVFLERKYATKMPVILSPRHFSIFQTRYFLTPNLLKESDLIYKDFMKEIQLDKPIYNFEHTDLFYWEVRMGAWGTSVISSLDLAHNVTVPMNNRKIIEKMLRFSHEDRKSDLVHKSIITKANPTLLHIEDEVKNLYFHSYRIWLEKIYYHYRTMFNKKG